MNNNLQILLDDVISEYGENKGYHNILIIMRWIER